VHVKNVADIAVILLGGRTLRPPIACRMPDHACRPSVHRRQRPVSYRTTGAVPGTADKAAALRSMRDLIA